ncbi:MAG: hypothetical protein K6F09_05080 [Clostridiales bacterium]|nr:hypothetical protein [Clostridiales bacterium]
MRSSFVCSMLAVLLCCVLICTCCLPMYCADGQNAEDVILFTKMDEETGLYIRLDESVRGVSEKLSAAFIPKNDVQTVPQIDSGKIRSLPPCDENGGRLELFLPVSWTPKDGVLHISGLLDGAGTAIEREILFSRDSYTIDRVWIDHPDPDKTETIRKYTRDIDTIYCVKGDTIRYGMDSSALLSRTQAIVSNDALRADADCAVTAVSAGECTLTLRIAQKMEYTVKVRVFGSAKARKQFLLRSAFADIGNIMGRYFHETVSQAIILGDASFLAAPILYPLAVIVAPIGFVAELFKLLINN